MSSLCTNRCVPSPKSLVEPLSAAGICDSRLSERDEHWLSLTARDEIDGAQGSHRTTETMTGHPQSLCAVLVDESQRVIPN